MKLMQSANEKYPVLDELDNASAGVPNTARQLICKCGIQRMNAGIGQTLMEFPCLSYS
jgi:hypothetical protein